MTKQNKVAKLKLFIDVFNTLKSKQDEEYLYKIAELCENVICKSCGRFNVRHCRLCRTCGEQLRYD